MNLTKHTIALALMTTALPQAAAQVLLDSSMNEAHVDFAHIGVEDGGQAQPYDSIYEGLHVAAENGTLHIAAGATAATPRFDKPMTIQAVGGAVTIGQREATPSVTWPISGGTDPVGPLSSTFGPRQKAGENYRYDFHRGMDIPTPVGTPVRAIADGVVRIDGDHDSYSDMIIQLIHETEDGTTYYSNYIHLSDSFVAEDQAVQRGEIIGETGVGASGFAHLHFEIRFDGLYQRNCVHPYGLLPYDDDRTAPELAIDLVDVADPTNPQVTVTASLPRVNDNDAMDLNAITVSTWADDGNTVTLVDSHTYAMNEWNYDYTPLSPEDPNVYMDDDTFNGCHVQPEIFATASDLYELTVTFTDLAGPANPAHLRVTATAQDLWGHLRELEY